MLLAALVTLLLLLPFHGRGDKTTEMVAVDIWNAFRAVSNDSALLAHIIPEMYGASMDKANPCFVFKMPNSQHDGFELLTMQRSDFAEPIFPNVTRRTQSAVDAVQHVKTSSNGGDWQQLGLPGWAGELQHPAQWLEQTHKDDTPTETAWTLPNHPRPEIHVNLNSQHLDGRITDIRVIAAQPEDLMNGRNVYLARANDPFGYSMKWALSNETQLGADRGKRDVARLYSMIKCSTNCEPLIYKGYGCYCGFGGHGVPTDGIDRCCRLHDKCYGQSNCISYLEYFVPYVWKCYRGKPLCAIDHGEWGGPDSCAARLCQCDLRLSRCLRNFHCPNRRAICHSSRTRRLQNLIFFD